MASYRIPLSVQTWAVQQLAFHIAALLFEYADRFPTARALRVRDPDRKPFSRLLPRVLMNQCFILLPCMIIAQHLGHCFTGPAHLPYIHFLIAMPAMAVGHDVVQYIVHRYLLHNPSVWLMRLLRHSMHHSTTASRGISACYMTAADFLLEIVLPYLLPLCLVGGGGADVRFHFLVAGLGAVGGVYEHSGYDFAIAFQLPSNEVDKAAPSGKRSFDLLIANLLNGLFDNRAHGEHHARATVSFADGFGSPGLCDTLLRTRWDLSSSRREQAEREWRLQGEAWK